MENKKFEEMIRVSKGVKVSLEDRNRYMFELFKEIENINVPLTDKSESITWWTTTGNMFIHVNKDCMGHITIYDCIIKRELSITP